MAAGNWPLIQLSTVGSVGTISKFDWAGFLIFALVLRVTWLWTWQKRQLWRVDRESRTDGVNLLDFSVCICVTDGDRPVTNVYGRPLPVVMKLMRVIASAGRHMSASLVCWTLHTAHCHRYFAPSRGAEYCDQLLCLSVCLSVHWHISKTTRQTFAKCSVTLAWSSSDGNAARYVLVTLWKTSCLFIMDGICQNQRKEKKERKRIDIAPFIYNVYLKVLRHGSHSFTGKYTMPAFFP